MTNSQDLWVSSSSLISTVGPPPFSHIASGGLAPPVASAFIGLILLPTSPRLRKQASASPLSPSPRPLRPKSMSSHTCEVPMPDVSLDRGSECMLKLRSWPRSVLGASAPMVSECALCLASLSSLSKLLTFAASRLSCRRSCCEDLCRLSARKRSLSRSSFASSACRWTRLIKLLALDSFSCSRELSRRTSSTSRCSCSTEFATSSARMPPCREEES
mmetsp:Transcript_89666/g.254201  ORF Transcript_89666/g.254201 Transcript_89666/m.254201 type:complete len:217 (-) Transcript_89666:1003-1653(-)